jgi:glycosyltransferase involved in cell wall biosynthesis
MTTRARSRTVQSLQSMNPQSDDEVETGDRSAPIELPAAPRRRVCFVTVEFHGLFKNGGIGTANTALALQLVANGFDVTVAIANSDESGPRLKVGNFAEQRSAWRECGINLEFVPPQPQIAGSFDDPRSASYCVFLYLQRAGFDIVLFNDNGGQGYFSLLAKHTGLFEAAPFMCVVAHGPLDWVHELNALEFYSRIPVVMAYMERRCAELADELVSPSHYLMEWMRVRGWVAPGHGRVIQNLLNIDATTAQESAAPYEISEIVFFGRQETRKGVTLFCDAIDLLIGGGKLRPERITFLGKFSRIGPLHSGIYLTERARHWGVPLRILASYDQEEALDYLRRPGVLAVIPSRAENSPCVVAECLRLGLLFIATDSGGTAELIAAADCKRCLFAAEAPALAHLLDEILQRGHRPARAAVSAADTLREWLSLLERASAAATAPVTAPTLSACLVWSDSAAFRSCLSSLQRQTGVQLEILVAAEATARVPELAREGSAGVTLVRSASGARGALRNAAAGAARGEYLLFIDEERATLVPQGAALLGTAARRSGADIVTALRHLGTGRAAMGPPARDGDLPIGGCVELGAFENCFGDGAMLVRRSTFAGQTGFASDCDGSVLDWLFLASAVLDGARLELAPAAVVIRRQQAQTLRALEQTVEDHRRILERYRQCPIDTIGRMLEPLFGVARQNRQKLRRALWHLTKGTRDLAERISSLDPTSEEASRLFMQYCCERRLIDLARDFALHNDLQFLPDLIAELNRASEEAAIDAIRTRSFGVRHTIDLTKELQARAWPIQGANAGDTRDLTFASDGSIQQTVAPGDSIIKFGGACPAGAVTVTVTAAVDAASDISLAALVCYASARPVLSAVGIEPSASAWWSGWVAPGAAHAVTSIVITLPTPLPEVLDLYFIARHAGGAAAVTVRWQTIMVDVCLLGHMTPSAIALATEATPLPIEVLYAGELLTDVSKVPFQVFVPGERTLLHPLVDKVALVRLPQSLPAGAVGLRCTVSLEHEKARVVEFGVWVLPVQSRPANGAAFAETENFSGWLAVDTAMQRRHLTLQLPEPSAEPMDLYLATRVVNAPDTHFCHAYWQDFAVLYRSASVADGALGLAVDEGRGA